MIPETRQENTNKTLRNSNHLTVPHFRTSMYQNAFIPNTSRNWNFLPPSIQCCQDRKQLKHSITTLYTTPQPPLFFTLGTKLGNTLHAQLRLGMSRLNAHQYTVQKSTDPACACGHGHENTNHFILDCPIFAAQRKHLIRQVSSHLNIDFQALTNTMKINLLLLGHNVTKNAAFLIANDFQNFLLSTNQARTQDFSMGGARA